MKISIQSLHFDADKKLLAFIEEKVNKLNTLGETIISGDVILKLDKGDHAENKLVEIKLHIKGAELFAKKQCKSFEEATDLCCEALTTQLKKHKSKIK